MDKAKYFLEPYQKNRTSLIAQVAGPNWSTAYNNNEDTDKLRRRKFVNLLSTYLQIVWRQLVSKNPRVSLNCFLPQFKPTVRKVQDRANLSFQRMGLANTLMRVTLDACYCLGV